MYTISESPSRYEDLVNILPKTRYVHIESPSRRVKSEDRAHRAAPDLKVFGHPQLLTRKVVYIFTTRPSHIYTWFDRFHVGCEVYNGSLSRRADARSHGEPWGTIKRPLGCQCDYRSLCGTRPRSCTSCNKCSACCGCWHHSRALMAALYVITFGKRPRRCISCNRCNTCCGFWPFSQALMATL